MLIRNNTSHCIFLSFPLTHVNGRRVQGEQSWLVVMWLLYPTGWNLCPPFELWLRLLYTSGLVMKFVARRVWAAASRSMLWHVIVGNLTFQTSSQHNFNCGVNVIHIKTSSDVKLDGPLLSDCWKTCKIKQLMLYWSSLKLKSEWKAVVYCFTCNFAATNLNIFIRDSMWLTITWLYPSYEVPLDSNLASLLHLCFLPLKGISTANFFTEPISKQKEKLLRIVIFFPGLGL